ncbi:hypothetical protein A7S34_06515 [Salmonella enterica]|uniref:Uncharacterized protein n=5 Tax=Salmonella enterica TaxID=28901 RepID=A0A5Z7X2Y4_SALNE|nr:hypothetical protein AW71_03890 [Salmonella enterica subsp. enterica serovar Montevideo str. CDC 07-0954]ATT84993.1 hypothetical protein AW72_20335 [Salmonella enterica subsp. enterica serovar Montevideo str. CDC 08-1942]ATT86332.1 hypothetical protein AW74_04060 [Salmonella enterica subsp. enterica serovar Montevideo str. CDC 2011K-1674]EAA5752000.1 hypothetical protein [Salmonella enterica]EAA7511391.1 hypothetical protein [Salmonella enterica subsp. enterica serovar Muenchen]EAU2211742.1
MPDLMADGGIFLILFFGVIFAVISTAILAIKCVFATCQLLKRVVFRNGSCQAGRGSTIGQDNIR